MGVTRWGICSAGKICNDFVCALKSLPENNQVVAVSARKLASAEDFANKFDIAVAYEGHEKLAADPNVDIVYIGSIHPYHFEHSMMMLRAGKHVLCEKPMGMNLKQATEVLEFAKEKKLFFMEGFWSRFFPTYHQIRKEIKEETIGKVQLLRMEFGSSMLHVDRASKLELGGGALLDLGCYVLQFAIMVFGEMPHKIHASGTMQQTGADDTTNITLHFSGNRMACLITAASCNLTNSAAVFGTKGKLEIPDYSWCPVKLLTPSGAKEFPLPMNKSHDLNFSHSEGFQYEVQAVNDCLQKGLLECELVSHEQSLIIMTTIDEIKKQIGLVYPADEQQ